MPGFDEEGISENFTSPYRKDPGSVARKISAAYSDSFYAPMQAAIADSIVQSHAKTATGPNLDRHALFLRLTRGSGESDADLRLRYARAFSTRRAAIQPDNIIRLVESAIGGSQGDVSIVENLDFETGLYKHGYYYVEFNIAILLAQGFSIDQVSDKIAEIELMLDSASSAGVIGRVYFLGGASYDVDQYDDPADVLGP